MSNATVGSVYAQIMDRVIKSSENDFEECGVEQSTLQDLSNDWQARLSGMHIAVFPWDPTPPPQQIPNPAIVPSNVAKPEPSPVPSSAPSQAPANYGGQHMKQEPGYENSFAGYGGMNGAAGPGGVQGGAQRAQQILQQRFGAQAANTLANLPQQNRQPQGLALPGQQAMQQPPRAQFNLQLPNQGQQQRSQQIGTQPQQRQSNGLANSQTDGAGDAMEEWKVLMASRREQGDEGQRVADNLLREQLDAMIERMDSGLMAPLNQQPKGTKRKVANKSYSIDTAEATSSPQAPFVPQLDGELGYEDDEKVDDEDAINSDLDDPEDELDKTGDEDIGDIMLCTYDKVQRVKNKWKCTLKDGVLSSGGKDYLFLKATGEFEW